MSTNTNDYPSCIKIPNTKQDHKTIQQYQTKESLPLAVQQKKIIRVNNALLSLANQIFGEEKWSYSITNQTLDFVDSAWGIYIVGCYTLIKIQLHSGIFHEDMGYSVKEGSVKGEAIHCARLASYNNALIKVLCSFGGKIKIETEQLAKELSNSLTLSKNKLSPPVSHDINETKEKEETVVENTNNPLCQMPEVSKSNINNISSNNDESCMKNQLTSKPNIVADQEDMNNKKLSIEEIMRQERKRKQMEKQMEYRRLMKEKELKGK
ncbi:hypothetical protein HZH68_014229 [Vespula germanica]|uniref:DNA repair protein RAD52 n=1 Tax=Vespula germanica TaxID=30212 RepID=A0A834MTC1_VESGE|nr:hypothetical protein HZH68_014229 [Vespula germanica]